MGIRTGFQIVNLLFKRRITIMNLLNWNDSVHESFLYNDMHGCSADIPAYVNRRVKMPKKLPDPGTVFEITMPEGDFIYARLYHSLKLGIFEGRYPSYPGFTNESAVSFYTWGDYDVLTLRIVDHIPFDNWNEASGPAQRLPDSSPGIIARMFYRIYYRGEIKKCFYNKYKEALPHKGYRSKEIAYRANGLWFDDNGREVPEHPFNR